jgi:hypoxanthine phosphoribosyltransferase
VRILKDLDVAIEGRHILVVEDIVDTGLTLSYLLANLKSRGAASVKLAALLDKYERCRIEESRSLRYAAEQI